MKDRLWAIAIEHRYTLQSYIGMMMVIFFQRVIDTLSHIDSSRFGSTLGIFIGRTVLNRLLIYTQHIFKTSSYLSMYTLTYPTTERTLCKANEYAEVCW